MNFLEPLLAVPFWKRLFDLLCCLIVMPVFFAAVILMAIYHRLVSPGPVLFKQERVGKDGRRFMIYKFRTMRVNAETVSHRAHLIHLMGSNAPMMKLDHSGDKRIIPGAKLLRATGLDELPQLINVFLGEMSLVGPRPCLPYEYENFLPWQRERVRAVPGLTGLWQVSGKNRTTFEQMIHFDIEYSRTLSPGLDARIIFLTVPAILRQVSDSRRARADTSAVAGVTLLPPQKLTQEFLHGPGA